MIVYKLNEQGYFDGEHNCQVCPKTGDWLYPANYTETSPPEAKKYKRLKWDNQSKAWNEVDDYTGAHIWNKETGELALCEKIDLPEGYTAEAPATPFDEWNEKKQAWVTNIKKEKENKWARIRAERNSKLANSDWTQLPDAKLTEKEKKAYTEYRQQLRDIPEDFNDPDKVIWPEAE